MMRSPAGLTVHSCCLLPFFALNAYCRPGEPVFDLVIKNGHIVDGTGNPWFPGDVGVEDGKISKIGDLSGAAAHRMIDATGHAVSPGFIDIHNHLGPTGLDKSPRRELHTPGCDHDRCRKLRAFRRPN